MAMSRLMFSPVRRFRLSLVLLCVATLFLGGCVTDFWESLFPPPPLYATRPVPAEVFAPEVLEAFYRAEPDPAPVTRVSVSPEGKVEPGGELLPEDYQPESYGSELWRRLDLRSFPSLLYVPDKDEPVTHATAAWSVDLGEKTNCALSTSYAGCTYRVVATFDYSGKGNRDWLVLSTEQLHRDESLVLVLWLLVKNPQAQGPLQAELLGVEERRGLGGSGSIMNGAAAKEKIVELRAALRLPPLPQP